MDRMGGKQLVNKVLVLLVIAAVVGAALGGLWLLSPGDAYASNHSATRSFSAISVAPGETVMVTISADNYGGLGRIVETVPDGFTTSGGGQTETIRLLAAGPQTRTYTVTATDSTGPHIFSGTISDETKNSRAVVGLTTVTITAPDPVPDEPTAPDPVPDEPTAVRTISPASVSPSGQFTVTIRADNYGGLGRIVETLPSGFTSTDAVGQTVTIRLLVEGPQTRTYTVTAPDTVDVYPFPSSGTLQDEEKNNHPIGIDTVTVQSPQPPAPPPPQPPIPTDRPGMVSFSMDMPKVEAALTATLSDPDDGVTGTTWQWSRSDTMDGTYTNIATAMSASYTPVDGDVGKYLKAKAMYRDTHRSGRAAEAMTANAVGSATPATGSALGDHYDSAANGGNGDGQLDTPEMLKAVRDYFAQESTITVSQMLELVRIYFAG